MYDTSDEATGLPPLDEVVPNDAILAIAWQVGQEGIVTVPGQPEPVAVRYLSVRGLTTASDGQTEWGQIHVAVPAESLPVMLEAWAQRVDEMESPPPSFVCPVCGAESFHPKDISYGYCGACHDFTGSP